MIKWLIAIVIALFLFSSLDKAMRKIGFGRLPGDFHVRMFGRNFDIPLASTLILSAFLSLVVYLL